MFCSSRAVLHVDDDPIITDLIGEHLKQAGYESEAVNDPLAVMQALIRGHYRIVVLDVHMPHKSGLQLLQEIKEFDAGIQVILLTSLVNEATITGANRLGAEACIFKPLADPTDFLSAIEDASRRNDRWWETLRDLTTRRKEQEAGCEV